MKKGLIALGILVILFIGYILSPWSNFLSQEGAKTSFFQKVQEADQSAKEAKDLAADQEIKDKGITATDVYTTLEDFKKVFDKESSEIGQTQDDPKEVQDRLDALGKQLDSVQMQYLEEVLKGANTNDDKKALSIELLTSSQTKQALEILTDFTLNGSSSSPASSDKHSGTSATTALRLQSLEGVGLYRQKEEAVTALRLIQSKSSEKLIIDRSERAIRNLNNSGTTVEQQENEALENVLKDSNQ